MTQFHWPGHSSAMTKTERVLDWKKKQKKLNKEKQQSLTEILWKEVLWSVEKDIGVCE